MASAHEDKNGDYIYISHHISDGELVNMGIVDKDGKADRSAGEGAIRLSREFVHAFFMNYAVKLLQEAKLISK